MLADASRKARLSARCLRLPIVLVRDPGVQPTVSDHVAAIIREPLQGRDYLCGLRPDTCMPVASVSAVARSLIQLSELSEQALPVKRVMNLPSLTVTPAQMVQAVERCRSVPQTQAVGHVRFGEDAQLQTIVDSWPRQFDSAHARALGIRADASIDDLVSDYLQRQSGQPDGQVGVRHHEY